MPMQPLFFAYATANSPYMQEATALAESLGRLNLSLHLSIVPGLGSWQKNTQLKAKIVRDLLTTFPERRCIYLDADSLVLRRPELFWTLPAGIDMAAILFAGRILASGVVMFGPASTTRSLELVERWINICERYPDKLPDGRDAWDQRCLQAALEMMQSRGRANFSPLPQEYNYIQELSEEAYPNLQPIILSTRGALHYQDMMDGKKATPGALARKLRAERDGVLHSLRQDMLPSGVQP